MKPPKSKPAIESGALIESASISKRPAPQLQTNNNHKHTIAGATTKQTIYKTKLPFAAFKTYYTKREIVVQVNLIPSLFDFNSEVQMPTHDVLCFYKFIYK